MHAIDSQSNQLANLSALYDQPASQSASQTVN